MASELDAIAGITVEKGKEDRDKTLPPHMELSLDELLSSILSALRLAGLDTFKDADLPEDDPVEDTTPSAPRTRVAKRISLGDLVAAGLISAGTELYLSQGGTTATGTVSTQGEIVVGGVAYASPSKAAQNALNSGRADANKVLSSNGWITWHIGSLAGPTLDSLRDQMAASRD
ncbi:hypothetical protein [Gordonia sp. (in: high G+C Gram-positive bacteria)]|uniref:restriction system modified-DNA reader domain-containing protein n=1 Tax=Gordonia sp. (in: high G+C Gram-positive bacteria) TaxID=84139 RepID=UPI00257D0456|nr:hypothetical protein [Gordonia sp. (in: high G+C Gram-positive bacteria)]